MMYLRSFLLSTCLLVLTLAAVMLVNREFLLITGFADPQQGGVFFFQSQAYIFYIAVIGAVLWTLLARWFVCNVMKVKIVGSGDSASVSQLSALLKQLATQKNINMPQLAVYESSDINAFTTGFSPSHAIIVVSSGLLYSLNHDEKKAVLAHEVTHIANHDMLTLSLMQGVINILVMLPCHCLGWVLDNKLLRRKTNRGLFYYLGWWSLQLSVGFVATMLVMWFSRWREFRADRGAAELVGSSSMQAALSCLKASRQHEELPDELGSFGISGHIGKGVRRLFASHPPLTERIVALREDWH